MSRVREHLIQKAVDLGQYVRDRRRAAGLTQTELAKAAGLTQVGLSNIEVGRADPKLGTVLALLAALGDELVSRPRPTEMTPEDVWRRG